MKDSLKTKQELIEELSVLKKKIKKLAKSESKLKLAESAVLESEENYRRLFETMAQGVVYQSADGQIISANPAAERILGLSLDQMQGKTSLDPGWKSIREDGSELPGQEHPAMVALRTGKPVERFIMGVYNPKNDAHTWIYVSATPLFNPGEKIPFQVYATFDDITERKQAEKTLQAKNEEYEALNEDVRSSVEELQAATEELQAQNEELQQQEVALRESEIKLQTIFDTVGTGILIIDKETQIIIDANPTAIEMTGLPKDKIIGQICHSLVCPAQIGKCPVKDIGQSVDHSERKLVCAKGHQKDILKTVHPITIRGRDCYVESFTDITDRKLAEEIVNKSEEKFNKAFHSSPILTAISTIEDGRFLDVNEIFLNKLLFSREEVVGKTSRELGFFTNPAQRKAIKEMTDEKGFAKNIETQITAKNGQIIDGLFSAEPITVNNEKCWLTVMVDVTEQKRAKEKLRESEEKYRRITENMSDLLMDIDVNGLYKYISPSFWRMLGYTPQDLLGTSVFDRVHPEDMDRVLTEFTEGIRTKTDREVEYRYRHANGHYIWLRSASNSLYDAAGEFVGAIINSNEITDRKRAEGFLKDVIIKNPMSVQILDKEGFTLEVNPSFDLLFGAAPPLDYSIFNDIQLAKQGMGAIFDQLRNGEVVHIPDTYFNVRDSIPGMPDVPVWIKTIGFPLNDSNEKPDRFVLMHENITERKQAEKALQESENRLLEITTQVPGVVYQFYVRLNGAMGFNYISDRSELVIGLKPDLEGYFERFVAIVIPEYRDGFIKSIEKSVKESSEWKYEGKLQKPSGEIIWFSGNATPSLVENEMVFNGIVTDITSRKQAEEEKRLLEERLQQADKMESIGTLAGGIAHDFNNLLMGMQGYASMTLMNLSQNDPNYERLKRIEEQVRSGADLTSQLLGFARGGRYEVKTTNMAEIIEKTSSMFGRTKKEITIHSKSSKDLWSVEVDRGQMEQVFLNLYVNAWQAMPGGGNIYLETKNEYLKDEQTFPYSVKPGKYIKITITDTGTGMDEKTKEKIFEPFFTTKGMGRGTGLGLASAYGIIKGHGGMINVHSEPDHGTTFTIYLPASEKEVKTEEIPTEEIVRGTETILLIDDEKVVMEINKELLESMGYTVYAAGSGQEGIAVYMEKKDKIDLIILDMIMPGISGSDTFDRLREINPNAKVLLSSGYSLTGKAQAIMDRGCNGFLQKPFKMEELSSKVREMFG